MRVTEVSLLEDRAQVTRAGVFELEVGLNTLRVEGVAPVIVDKTLVVQVGEGARLLDARVERRSLAKEADRPDRLRSLRAEADELDARIERLKGVAARARTEAASLESLLTATHAEIAEDVAFGRSAESSWSQGLDAVLNQLREARLRLEGLLLELEEAEERRMKLGVRLQAMEQPSDETATDVRLVVDAGAAMAVQVELRYLVPGACWRPMHLAKLVEADGGGPGKLGFSTEACVWQNTGEDWHGVALQLSTERPSLGVAPPTLDTEELHTQPKSREVLVETREEAIEDAGLGGEGPAVVVSDVPGIDDGGEARLFVAAGAVDVPSDGRPVRVPIMLSETEVERSRVLMAELVPKVLIKTVQANKGGQPLLPGPVELIQRGGRVGRTSIPFVAPGEHFELGWGPDPELRVVRTKREKKSESKILSAWTTVPIEVEIHVSNIGRWPRTVEVIERIPVSELERVKVHPLTQATSGGAVPDRDGFVRWTLEIGPFGRERLQLGYTIEKHADVVGI